MPSGLASSLSLIWAITLGACLLQVANGLLQIVLPLRMQADGLSIEAIGWVSGAYGLGFAIGCFLIPLLVRHVGYIRAFSSLAAISAVVALGFTQADHVAAWMVLRLLSGIVLAGLFTVIDGWVSSRATRGNRGRIVALYMVFTKVALMLAPFGIGLGSIKGYELFLAIASLMCLSLLPISATIAEEPKAPTSVRLIVPTLFRLAPSAVVGAFAVGLMNSTVLALAPLYGVGIGFSTAMAAFLVLALQAGSLLFQWPLGWLSDMIDRRKVIAGLSAATALVSIAILWAEGAVDPLVIFACFALWGGTALCIYAVCIAHACDIVPADNIVPTISSLLVCWAIGGMVGPIPATAFMAAFGPNGLFFYCAIVAVSLAVYVMVRIARKRREPVGSGFVNIPATSPASAELSPRSPDVGEKP